MGGYMRKCIIISLNSTTIKNRNRARLELDYCINLRYSLLNGIHFVILVFCLSTKYDSTVWQEVL